MKKRIKTSNFRSDFYTIFVTLDASGERTTAATSSPWTMRWVSRHFRLFKIYNCLFKHGTDGGGLRFHRELPRDETAQHGRRQRGHQIRIRKLLQHHSMTYIMGLKMVIAVNMPDLSRYWMEISFAIRTFSESCGELRDEQEKLHRLTLRSEIEKQEQL